MAASQSPRSPRARQRREPRAPEKGAGEYAKEAISEWRRAAKLGVAALSPVARNAIASARTKRQARTKGSLRERVGADSGKDGGRLGTAADAVLSKMGAPGKAASRLGLGSRLVARLRQDSVDEEEPGAFEDDEYEEPEEEPEAYEEDELGDEPADEAYMDEAADVGAPEAYEEVAR